MNNAKEILIQTLKTIEGEEGELQTELRESIANFFDSVGWTVIRDWNDCYPTIDDCIDFMLDETVTDDESLNNFVREHLFQTENVCIDSTPFATWLYFKIMDGIHSGKADIEYLYESMPQWAWDEWDIGREYSDRQDGLRDFHHDGLIMAARGK